MKLILLVHPSTFATVSMPRYAGMIQRGMEERGHEVRIWTSRPFLSRLPIRSGFLNKWLNYGDQFLIYPRELRHRVDREPSDTLFVVADQALGMWVPYLAHRPHVVHCHDFLALKSALGEFPENPTRWTGRKYQQLIRKGFACGKAFISVSEKSREDLHRFLPKTPSISEVVYNGLNHCFRPMDLEKRTSLLKQTSVEVSDNGFVVHIGGNQWYKNRKGVLEIYRAYASVHSQPLALWMIGTAPTEELLNLAAAVPRPGQVHFLAGLSNEQVNAAYSHARALLFPSLEEGFGWPIAEAMSAGCPVITTNIAPMTEVAGNAARLIPRMPADAAGQKAWAKSAAAILVELLSRDADGRAKLVEAGRLNAARFDPESALAAYEKIYKRALAQSRKSKPAGNERPFETGIAISHAE